MNVTIKAHMPERFRRVAKTLGLTLFASRGANGAIDADMWHGLSLVLIARLEPEEIALLAWAALRSMPSEQAEMVADTVLAPFDDLSEAA